MSDESRSESHQAPKGDKKAKLVVNIRRDITIEIGKVASMQHSILARIIAVY